jgi:translation elongation factor EF-1beta
VYGFSSFGSKQCIIDCSTVAIQQVQDKLSTTKREEQQPGRIELEVGDVLQPPLPYADNLFDVWVDKGLIDALFCGGDDYYQELKQCSSLLQEAHRVLKPNGLCLVISLAQDHTLKLLLHALGYLEMTISEHHHYSSSIGQWSIPIEIHEIKPLSNASSLRPFALAFRRGSPWLESTLSRGRDTTISIDDAKKPVIVLFDEHGMVQESLDEQNFCWEAVNNLVQSSQLRYLAKWKQMSRDNNICNSSECYSNDNKINYILATLCIKPWDVETNLFDLKKRIKSNEEYLRFNLKWKSEEIKAIGFGISLLQITLIIPRENLEDLCECIATQEEDLVQSVDVDWQSTCRVFTNAVGSLTEKQSPYK